MRVLQVVSMLTADARFGGPTSVAMVQSQALAEQGHDVTLAAGGTAGAELRGAGFTIVQRRLRPLPLYRGLAGTCSPGLARWLVCNAHRFDVAHIHLGRDMVSFPAAEVLRRSGIPYFAQTHGMVSADSRLRSRVVDSLGMQSILAQAQSVLCLTKDEEVDISTVAPKAKVARLLNGVTISDASANHSSKSPRVVFIARYHARKRADTFIRVAAILASHRYRPRFEMYGPDEGELAHLMALRGELGVGRICEIGGSLRPDEVKEVMLGAQAYVLPSYDEPFPMTALEAMSLGLPTFITGSNGLAPYMKAAKLGCAVSDGSPERIAEQIDAALSSPQHWQSLAERGRNMVHQTFTARSVVSQLTDHYRAAVTYPLGRGA